MFTNSVTSIPTIPSLRILSPNLNVLGVATLSPDCRESNNWFKAEEFTCDEELPEERDPEEMELEDEELRLDREVEPLLEEPLPPE